MLFILELRRSLAFCCIAFVCPLAVGQSDPSVSVLDRVEQQTVAFMDDLSNLTCEETIVQEKYDVKGNIQALDRSHYDYFIMANGEGDDFQVMESRTEKSAMPAKVSPLLVTNGFSTLLLIFHPHYRNSFNFEVGRPEPMDGQSVVPIQFHHIADQRSPAVLVSGEHNYDLALQGTAWVNQQSDQIVRIDATLEHDMSEVGLSSLSIQVQYELSDRGDGYKKLVLPVRAEVDLQTQHHHWRNAHLFSRYRTFSTSAEQNPGVTILRPPTTEATPEGPGKPKEIQ